MALSVDLRSLPRENAFRFHHKIKLFVLRHDEDCSEMSEYAQTSSFLIGFHKEEFFTTALTSLEQSVPSCSCNFDRKYRCGHRNLACLVTNRIGMQIHEAEL